MNLDGLIATEPPDDWSEFTDSQKILEMIKLIRKWRLQGAVAVDLRGLFLNFTQWGVHDENYINGQYKIWSNSVFLQLNMLPYKDMRMKTLCNTKNLGQQTVNGFEGDWWRLNFNAYRGKGIKNNTTLMTIYVDDKDFKLLMLYLKQ